MNDSNKIIKSASKAAGLSVEQLGEILDITSPTSTEAILEQFITRDDDLLKIKQDVTKLASSDLPILIVGETGTGKELIARALHGIRKQSAFIAVNTAGIPDTLIEAEFFGAERGAYTGCDRNRDGYLKAAGNGTLFLDEIGDMPLLLQSKLLRVLQDKTARSLGSTVEYFVNCRFIAATNRSDLDKTMRADIYYRLAGHVIKLKPLRERGPSDIHLICEKMKFLPNEFMFTHKWPGNIRELLNYIKAQKCLCS